MTWYEIFPQILNMSLTASVIICVVLLCRLLLKRAPKIYSYVLWSVVLFRLLCPVSLSAPISVLGIFDTPVLEQTSENAGDKASVTSSIMYIPTDIVHTEYPEITLPIPGVGDMISKSVNERLSWGEEQLRADPLEAPVTFATYLWMFGIMGMLVSGMVSYVRLHGNIVGALKIRDNVYVTDHISGPFVIGMIKPKIYLPSELDEKEHSYIILHEKHHIHRGDPIFKMVAYIALCIHWFNPLVWLFFKLFVKDMEMSCDEAVVNKLGDSIRADYSASLLQLATGRQMLFGSPLAFGETEPTGRIKNLSRWKKPTIVISVFAILLCIVAVIVSIFNPAVSKDTLRMIEQESPVMGNIVKYEVDFGKQVEESNVYAEVWEKGECEVIACLPVDQRAKQLCIQMKDRKADGKTAGIDIRLESDVPGGMQATYAELPQEFSSIGWAFNAYEEGAQVIAVPGEEKILAAMAFDTGEGVRVFDPETLLKEPERLEQTEYMLVIRAVFEEKGSRLDVDDSLQGAEDKWDCTVHCAEESGENAYVITYSEEEILVDTGCITFQNRNLFAITIHLIGKGKEAFVSEIAPGENVVFMQADKEVTYTVGIHADVEEGTELNLMVYDGEWSEVYTPEVDSEYVLNQAIKEAIMNQYKPKKPDGLYHCVDFVLLDQEEICGVAPVDSGKDNTELITVYGMALHESLGFSGATFHEVEYDYVPVKLKFQKESEYEYVLKDAWFPEKPIESWDSYQEAIWDTFSPYSEELADDMIYAIQDDIYLTSLKQNCYEQAVSFGEVDTDTVIEGLLEQITKSPITLLSGLQNYFEAHKLECRELTYYGKYTLWYCFGEFMKGGQTGLRGQIMASVCKDIALGWGEALPIDSENPAATGQDWFDIFRSNAEELQKQYSEDELNELYHASWLLLQLIQLQVLSK